jgi:hypothetical protein
VNAILSTDDLKAATGYDRAGDIERCLRTAGIRFFYGKGGRIVTTTDAVNAALGIQSQSPPASQEFEFD